MPNCSTCKKDFPGQALIGGVGKLICEDCYGEELSMCKSFKNGFDFVVKYFPESNSILLKRKNGISCLCPYHEDDNWCGSHCPHFVVENCNIVDKKCSLLLTCGRHLQRVVEIL